MVGARSKGIVLPERPQPSVHLSTCDVESTLAEECAYRMDGNYCHCPYFYFFFRPGSNEFEGVNAGSKFRMIGNDAEFSKHLR